MKPWDNRWLYIGKVLDNWGDCVQIQITVWRKRK